MNAIIFMCAVLQSKKQSTVLGNIIQGGIVYIYRRLMLINHDILAIYQLFYFSVTAGGWMSPTKTCLPLTEEYFIFEIIPLLLSIE